MSYGKDTVICRITRIIYYHSARMSARHLETHKNFTISRDISGNESRYPAISRLGLSSVSARRIL